MSLYQPQVSDSNVILSITFRPIMPFNIKHDMDALLAPNVILVMHLVT